MKLKEVFALTMRKNEIAYRNAQIHTELNELEIGNLFGIYHKDKLLRAIELGDELYDLTVELREIFRKEGNKTAMIAEDRILSRIEDALWLLKMDYELGCYLP